MFQPQIVGFGAQKAGTTWLFDNLVTNPGIWRPALKEMHYFNYLETGARWMLEGHRTKLERKLVRARRIGAKRRAEHLDRLLTIPMLSLDWYREAYRPCPENKQSVDITPAYAMLSEGSLTKMEETLGNSFRVIFILRDPVARVISSIKNEAIADERNSREIDFWIDRARRGPVRRRSDYITTVNRLDAAFKDRVLYLPFGQIKRDPVRLLRSIEQHCCLPEGNYVTAGKMKHKSPSVHVPEGAETSIREMLAEQYAGIEERFGRQFLDAI